MPEAIHVSMAELRVVKNPVRLICLGLGSCIAVALWDPSTKIGGMAHVMLPDEKRSTKKSTGRPGKYANTAVKNLFEEMKKMGANPSRIIAKIAGGAHMFKQSFPGIEDIGKQNIAAVKKSLKELNLKLMSEDIGGSVGRTVELDTATGKLLIRSFYAGMRIL